MACHLNSANDEIIESKLRPSEINTVQEDSKDVVNSSRENEVVDNNVGNHYSKRRGYSIIKLSVLNVVV